MKLGIVGCGRAARALHLPAIRRGGAFRLTAAADPDRNALREACLRFRIPFGYDGAEKLLARPDLAAVALCLPPSLHAFWGERALALGVPLFIEKPAGLALADNEQLVLAAQEARLPVLVGFNLRHHRFVRRARALIKAGALGAVTAIRSTFIGREEDPGGWRGLPGRGGGLLLDLAVHHLDLFRFLLGSELEDVSASAGPEGITLGARLETVRTESLFGRGPRVRHEVNIVGRKGTLSLSLYDFDGFKAGGSVLERGKEWLLALPRAVAQAPYGGVYMDSYRAQWDHFAAVARGEAAPIATLEDAGRALEAARRADECLHPRSADETQEVTL